MSVNYVVLEDVERDFKDYYSTNQNIVFKLLQCITCLFMERKDMIEKIELDDEPKRIFDSVTLLSDDEIKAFYEYVLKTVNDFKTEIECVLPCIPNDDKNKEFTKKINKYLKIKRTINDEVLKNIANEGNISKDCADKDIRKLTGFKAYYIMFTFHHSRKNMIDCKELVNSYNYFFEYPLWHYTQSQLVLLEAKENSSKKIEKAISEARKCIQMFEGQSNNSVDYPGIYNNFSELVFEASDLGEEDIFKENLKDAKKYIEIAIECDENYAKYYYTKGKLLLAESTVKKVDLYEEAENLFQKAIDIEDSSNDNYALKIVDYETYLMRCKTEKRILELDNALEVANQTQENVKNTLNKSMAELNNQKKETLEVLGFFSGIISLIIVTSQIVISLDVFSASVVMLLFLGVLIIAFSFFHFIVLNGERKSIKPVLIFNILGIILIIVAIAISIFCVIEN